MKRCEPEKNDRNDGGDSDNYITKEGKTTVKIVSSGPNETSINGSDFFLIKIVSGDKFLKPRVYVTPKSMWAVDLLITACGYDPETIPVGVEIDQNLFVGKTVIADLKFRGDYLQVRKFHPIDEDAELKPWPTPALSPAPPLLS